MNKKIAPTFTALTLLFLPVAVLAINIPSFPPGANVNVMTIIDAVFSFIWPLFAGFSVVMFVIAGFMFLLANGDVTKAGGARSAVIWGSVGVAVGVLAFSIPFLVKFTLGI